MNRFLWANFLLLLIFCSFEQCFLFSDFYNTTFITTVGHRGLPVLAASISLLIPLAYWKHLRNNSTKKLLQAELIALIIINPIMYFSVATMSQCDPDGHKWNVSLLAGPQAITPITKEASSRPGALVAFYWLPYYLQFFQIGVNR